MKADEQWRGYMLWCEYFNGVQHEVCEQGINYMDVRQISEPPGLPAEFPCTSSNGTEVKCPLAQFPSEAEAQAKEAETQRMIRGFFENLQNDICPHCRTAIEARRQGGRCVYAEPCGCRLYQGKLK